MLRKSIIIILLLIPVVSLPQKKKEKTVTKTKIETTEKKEPKKISTVIPVQAQYSHDFKLAKTFFNRRTDLGGRGEILEVEMEVINNTDEPIDLYIFVVATYEKHEKTNSSFEIPLPPKERIRSFVPYPFDIKNFTYPDYDDQGVQKKDRKGRDMIKLVKFPKDPKLGINIQTGKPYHITNKLFIRTEHLSKYRNNYYFFNRVVILMFDMNGKPVFRQNYYLRGWRR